MSALTAILPKVAPLVGKLASAHDPEILGAVRALRRVLAAQGLTFNDLALALEPRQEIVFVEPEPWVPETWHELARWVVANDRGRLQPHEREFATTMARRLVMQGEPSPKQGEWLRSLYSKLGGEK